ncbi:MAG: hypothetical protein ACE5GK_02065 [Nitrospiria bacterium]
MKMKGNIKVAAAFFAVFLGVSTSVTTVFACSSLGPGKHLGLVWMIDPIQKSITLIDAETRNPVSFFIGEDFIKTVKMNDTVVITFEKEEGRLIVKNLVVQPVKMSAL